MSVDTLKQGCGSGRLQTMLDNILRELKHELKWPSVGQVNGITPERAEHLRQYIECEGYKVKVSPMEPGTFVFSVEPRENSALQEVLVEDLEGVLFDD